MPSSRQKPVTSRSTIANHPRCREIELARAGGMTLDQIANAFRVGRVAVHRHMATLSKEQRRALAAEVEAIGGVHSREVAAGLAALAVRHPAARDDIADLVARLLHVPPSRLVAAPMSAN